MQMEKTSVNHRQDVSAYIKKTRCMQYYRLSQLSVKYLTVQLVLAGFPLWLPQ